MSTQPKKKLAARIYDAIFPPKPVKRTYAAARRDRLNADWTTMPTSANWERRVSLHTLIARSRAAARDDLHIVNYLRLMRDNVIGQHGIQLQCRAKTPYKNRLNIDLNKRVEEAFWEWGHAETCTVSGQLDWKGVQDLCVTQHERDGAFLVQMVDADNEFGFALRTWDVTWLDHTYNDTTRDGNRIIMSVEIDANNKPVAYWLTTPPTEINFALRRERQRTRIPAERMIHGFRILDDESQVHGVPGTAAALLPAKFAYGYNEGVITSARASAHTFGVLKNTVPDGEGSTFNGEEDPETGQIKHPMVDSSPLSITPMLPGWELQQFDPKQPTQNHAAFKETLDMDIAVALGVPYFLLMGNWKAVNFSSSRGGLGEFRERCKTNQNFYAMTLCRRVFHEWLRRAWLSEKVKMTASDYLELQNPAWQPRGFDYVDPTKDVISDETKLQNRLIAPSEILAERGVDYVDFLDRWENDRLLAAAKGIDIDEIYAPKQAAAAPPASEPDDDEADTKDDKAKDERHLLNGHGVFVG